MAISMAPEPGWPSRGEEWRKSTEPTPATELELVQLLVAHLPHGVSWALECTVQGRARIDLCFTDWRGVHGIEAKLRDWRRGIGQTYLNRYSVDYSHLALPVARIGGVVHREAARFGLGLLAVSNEGVWVVNEAQKGVPSNETLQALAKQCVRGGS